MASPSTSSAKKTIAIIGAGVSGLQAARTLLTHPTSAFYEVIILEARDRIGGRVNTKRQWGFPLDYGANFIHGTDGNPLTRIAKAAGATFIPSTSVGLRRYYGPNGEHTSADDSALVYQKVWEYSDAAVEYSRDYNVGRNKSMADFCSTRLTEDKDLDSDERRHLVEDGLEMLAGIAACDLDKMSLKYYWMEEDLPGDRPFIDSSYAPIVEYIAQPSLLANLVKFRTQISTIEVDPSLEKPITLTSTENETFHADSVICTLPLGVLQSKTTTFTPSLPPRIQRAISNLGVGVLEKIFIRFSEPWWLGPIQNASIGIEFYRFTSLETTKQVMPRGTLNFFSLARIHKPQPVFGVFISTDLAKYLVVLPKEELKELLQTHYIPHLPNYTSDNPACRILEIDSSTWSADPFSGFGSYTHIPVGSDTGDENMKILSEKIMDAGDGGIWFAGEHTADTEMIDEVKYTTMATVTAAYKTGERAANHVIRTHTSELLN